MTDEIEWWDYEDTTEMANALAGDIQEVERLLQVSADWF